MATMSDAAAAAIAAQLSRGEFLLAADLGAAALADDDGVDPEVAWLTGLALARCGATSRAERLLAELDLVSLVSDATPRLREDVLGLRARLAKDRALSAPEPDRPALATLAAQLYEVASQAVPSHYALVNAATMWRLAGDESASGRAAEQALELLAGLETTDDYWALASIAEARLLLADPSAAADALQAATALHPDWSMRSSTVRQLRLVCTLLGLPPEILDLIGLPTIAHYTGHMFRTGPEPVLRRSIDALLEKRSVGAVYGSLACGADIVVAETAREAGVEVHLVLPCPREEFLERSVKPGGTDWVDRAHTLLAGVTVTEEPTLSLDDEAMFAYGDQLAMGFALTRAAQLGTDVFQIALWDGTSSAGEAGTAAAVARWRQAGHTTSVVTLSRDDLVPIGSRRPQLPSDRRARGVRSMIFADVKGFSTLAEDRLPDFFERVMGALAEVLDDYDDDLRYRNTWGDALYLVFDHAAAAGQCALDLQARIDGLAGEPGWSELSMRIGVHAGPVFDGHDHVRDEPTFYGTHVTRAARIEPRTPPGEVYVTASFAALIALDPIASLRLEYVGHVPTAKDYGDFPMYVLGRGGRVG
jgi:class 3 adenylate cyclase